MFTVYLLLKLLPIAMGWGVSYHVGNNCAV